MSARRAQVVASVTSLLAVIVQPSAFAQEPPPPAVVAECTVAKEIATGPPTWVQRILGGRLLWPISTGEGVSVAVLSTGVDKANAQFPAGAVRPGLDVLNVAPAGADTDCDGRGTFVAGLIGARPEKGTSFAGLAPGAEIVPVRVAQRVTDGSTVFQTGGGPRELARGIRWAGEQGVKVIAVTVTTPEDTPELRLAVRDVTARGSLVISGGAIEDSASAGGGDVALPQFPSAYPEVLGVGAVAEDGSTLATADSATYLDVEAPAGAAVSTASVGGQVGLGHTVAQDDPAAATAAVAATAALMLELQPKSTPAALTRRILATALQKPAGPPVLSPRDALTTRPVGAARPALADGAIRMPVRPRHTPAERLALQIAGVAVLALGLASATAVVLRGRDERRARP